MRGLPQTLLFDLQQQWGAVAQIALRDGEAQLASDLTACRPHSLVQDNLTILCPSMLVERSTQDPHVTLSIARWVQHVAGHTVRIHLRSEQAEQSGRQARYQQAEAHPLIQALRQRFAADIVSREPISHAAWLERLRGIGSPDQTSDLSE